MLKTSQIYQMIIVIKISLQTLVKLYWLLLLEDQNGEIHKNMFAFG